MSLPIVITVHGNQECDASSTVIWDNQFADIVCLYLFFDITE